NACTRTSRCRAVVMVARGLDTTRTRTAPTVPADGYIPGALDRARPRWPNRWIAYAAGVDDQTEDGPEQPVRPPATVRLAAALVAVEAAGLLIVALVLAGLAIAHTSNRLWAALAIVGFALLGALVLAGCARGLLGLRPSA